MTTKNKEYLLTQQEFAFLDESNRIERAYQEGRQKGVDQETIMFDAINAWEFLKEKKEIQVSYIKDVHFLLMLSINRNIAGTFRTQDVWIGGIRKRFIATTLFQEELEKLCTSMNIPSSHLKKKEKEEQAKSLHVLFEGIHPFLDGNGRTGRLLYNWHRLKLGLPIHIIHEGEEQWEYYGWFPTSE